MKKLISEFSGLFIILIIISSCSKNNVAQRSEWDDMYFSSVDRENLTASNKEFYDQNFNETYQEPLNSDQATNYSDVNYSSKTINPEYIAKYTSNSPEDSDPGVSTEYFDENYNNSDASEDIVPQRYSSYSGSNSGGFGIYPSFAFGYGSGFGYNPYYSPYRYYEPFGYYPSYGYPYSYGSRLSLRFGYGSSFYNPYSSFYSPGSPWGGYPSAYGYGVPSGYGYCPVGGGSGSTYYYTRNDVTASSNGRVVSVRNVTRGPRSSRGSVNSRRNDYRSGDNDSRFFPDGKSTIVSNGKSTSGRSQNNYYKRTSSRNTTDQNTRGYQTGRSYNNSGSRTRTGVSASNYSRSSGSSYKTGSSRGSILRALTGSGGSNSRSTGKGRSSFYSNPSRSSGTSFRSSSGSSGRSISTGSSRSSSGSSRSSSSGSSGGSSSGSKRGN